MTNDATASPSSSESDKAWAGLEKALQTLSLTTKACPPLRSAIDDLTSCLPIFEAAVNSRKDHEDLANGLKAMVQLLIKHLQDAAPEIITTNIMDVVEAVRRELELIGKRQSHDGLSRVFGAINNEEDLIRRYRRIEQLFRQLQGEASLCTWSISSKILVNAQLEGLHPAKLARYNSELSVDVSRRTCTENTRIGILQNLHNWAEDQGLAKIYWMNGMAGTGKTTIACSISTAIEDEHLEPEEQESMKIVVWTVVCACEPVLINTIAAISGLGCKEEAITSLESLRSVLHVSEHNELVTTLHASFPDYILNQKRSGRFTCNVPIHSRLLSERCFEIMKAQLRFNICGIQSSFIPDDEIPDLKERIDANISAELSYACRFWMDHLSLVTTDSGGLSQANGPISPMVNDFLSHRLLFWMEVLNLTKRKLIGVAATSKLIAWLRRIVNEEPKLHELASNAQAFVIGYASRPISNYTPHIYLSALPFAPALLHYSTKFKGLINVSGTLLNKINTAALGTWESESSIYSVAFLPKGEHIVYGNEGGELCIQNAHDGKHVVRSFEAHEKPITCMAVSRDGTRIVTDSNGLTLYLWDAQNGDLISGPFQGQSGLITAVALSFDGAHIVCGSADGVVGLWVSQDETAPIRRLSGHSAQVNSVAFSPNGINVISASSDCTIRVWDIFMGIDIFASATHRNPVILAQFSPDGSSFTSFSLLDQGSGHDHVKGHLCVWDTSNMSPRSEKLIELNPGPSATIAISPSGDFLAGLTSNSSSITIWDTHTRAPVAGPFTGHTAPLRSIAFSNDDTRIVSASDDKTVRIWNVHGAAQRTKASSYLWGVNSQPLTITQEPMRVAFGDLDALPTVIYILLPELKVTTSIDVTSPDQSQVKLLQFSLDGSSMFSIYASGTICIWDIHTARLVNGPHRCSTSGSFDSVACSTDGTRVLTCRSGNIEIWDAQSNRSIFLPIPGGLCYWAVIPVFSQKGGSFLTNSTDQGGVVHMHVWDADSGTLIAGPYQQKTGLGVSPDGTYVVCTGRPLDVIWLLDISTGKALTMPFEGPCNSHAPVAGFSPDGHYLVCTAGNHCYIWDMRDQRLINSLTLYSTEPYTPLDFTSIACSADGWCTLFGRVHTPRGNVSRAWQFHIDIPRSAVHSDGWVVDSYSRPLFWVPIEIRNDLPSGNGIFIENGDFLYIGHDNMLVGDDWSKCYVNDRQD